MNCLSYALNFWKDNPSYKIWYNSYHCINIPASVEAPFPNKEFLPIEVFGLEYFTDWLNKGLITNYDYILLNQYFNDKR